MTGPGGPGAGEAGFTMIEVAITMVIGLVVLFAAFTVLDTTVRQQAKVADRTEAVQRGRQAMQAMTQQLRSTMCLVAVTPPRSIVAGTDDQVTFYADLTGGAQPPQTRTLTYDGARQTITERQFPATATAPMAWSATPSRTRDLLTFAMRVGGITPIFRYYAYSEPGVLDSTPLPTPLSAADAGRAVDVAIAFAAGPTSGPDDRGTVFQSDVFTRFASPPNPTAPMPCS